MIRQVITGSIAGYLLGSMLREADSHFGQKRTPKVNIMKYNDDVITLELELDPLDKLFSSGISACFEPMLPKGCDSITSLSTYISEKANNATKIKAFLGTILIPLEPYINSRYYDYFIAAYFKKEFAMVLASTHLAAGFFRGKTELGFCINPIGVACKKIKEFFYKPVVLDAETRRKQTLEAGETRVNYAASSVL